ncbi:MAG: hypothetical protein OEW00_07070 [candidate division Zixibacteria bacterium]|nr:hypothetical protein [candidate division Zixibacteria bacterium]
MRNTVLLTALTVMAVIVLAGPATAGVELGISITDEGVKGFYLAIGEQYRVPQKDIIVVKKQQIPDEELPVIFFLAARAQVSSGKIIELRLKGMSWMEITAYFGWGAGIYYVPVKGDPGPPYGKAYGHYRNHKRNKWGEIHLSDADIVNLVNLKFICEHHGYSPDEVIKMRAGGKDFVSINSKVKEHKQKQKEKALAQQEEDDSAGNSKSKGKGKNK